MKVFADINICGNCPTKPQKNVLPLIRLGIHSMVLPVCSIANEYFPSRVSIKESSVAKLGSECRRVYRIFSHVFFHLLIIFHPFEHETYLCRFTVLVTKYKLMSRDNLIASIIKEDGITECEG